MDKRQVNTAARHSLVSSLPGTRTVYSRLKTPSVVSKMSPTTCACSLLTLWIIRLRRGLCGDRQVAGGVMCLRDCHLIG